MTTTAQLTTAGAIDEATVIASDEAPATVALPQPARPSATTAADATSLKSKAVRGAAWTIGGFAASQVLRLAGNMVLSRLLFPKAFGVMAIVNVFLIGLQMFSDLGIGPSIIQNKRGEDKDFVDTAWTIQVGRGWLLWLAACALAWPAARFYGEPSLAWYIPVAALSAVASGFQSMSLFTLNRNLALGKLTLIELTSQATMLVGMIVLGLATRSVWALVFGNVIMQCTTTILSHVIATHRVRFRWDPDSAKVLLSFGRTVFLSTLILFMANQSERMILGRYAALELLGIYSIAYFLARVGTMATIGLTSKVLFPAFSKLMREDETRAAHYYVKTSTVVNVCGLAGLAVLVAIGPWLIRHMYDHRYWAAGAMLQVLAVQSVFEMMRCPANYLLLAAGRPGFGVWAWGSRALTLFVGLPLAFKFGDFHTAVWVVALSTFPPAVVFAYGMGRVFPSIRVREALGCVVTFVAALSIYWLLH